MTSPQERELRKRRRHPQVKIKTNLTTNTNTIINTKTNINIEHTNIYLVQQTAIIINRTALLRNKIVSPPRGREKQEKTEEEKLKQKAHPSSADFPVYDECDIYGLGYTHEPTQGSCPGWLKTVDGLQTVVGLWFYPGNTRTWLNTLIVNFL